jgi:hypothetical protein
VELVAIGSNVQNIRRSRILLAGLSGFFHFMMHSRIMTGESLPTVLRMAIAYCRIGPKS